jgi:hypothetical protein
MRRIAELELNGKRALKTNGTAPAMISTKRGVRQFRTRLVGKTASMEPANASQHEALKREWTDQYVMVRGDRPELKRFDGIVGRVVTVNFNNKALIDFQDGGWYDISASADYLTKLDSAEAKAKYNPKANCAQVIPEKQG